MKHIAPFALPIYKSWHYKNEYTCEAELLTMVDVAKMIIGGHIDVTELVCILMIDPELGNNINATKDVAHLVWLHYDNKDLCPDSDILNWLDEQGEYTDHFQSEEA